MAGGTFDKAVGKVRPGTYINFTSEEQATILGSSRGVVILPLVNTNYGPAKKLISLTAGSPDAARAMLGYSIYDDDPAGNMLLIREAFKNASTVIVYMCTEGTAAATGEGGGLTATAKYKGSRGNDLSYAVIANTNDTFDVEVYLSNSKKEAFEQVTTVEELAVSEYIDFTGEGLEEVAGVNLSGGEDGTTSNDDVTQFLDDAEGIKWNTMAFPLEDSTLISAVKTKVKYMREDVGKKVQAVVSGLAADYEGIINVTNGYYLDDDAIAPVKATAFVAGMTAGATYTQSNTYRSVEGATEVYLPKTHEEAVEAINKGEFFFSISEAGTVVVEYDINTLITFADGKGESYRKNRVIRVLDSFAESLTLNFTPNKYDNSPTGWIVMEGIGQSILKLYLDAGAIMNVDYDTDFLVDKELSTGDKTYFNVAIQPVDSAEKLFFTVTTR